MSSFALEIYRSEDWQDISGDLVDSDLIPFISRNRDYSPTGDSMEIEIGFACDYTPVIDDALRIKYGTDVVYAGTGEKVLPSYKDARNIVKLKNDLLLLDDKKISYEVIHDAVAADTGDYKYFTNGGMACIGLLNLLQKLFVLSGLTLDVSDLYDAVAFHYEENEGAEDFDVTYKDLFVWENQLYCINQTIAAPHTLFEHDEIQNQITHFAYLQEIFSQLGFGIYMTDYRTFKLIAPTVNYVVNNDDKYQYQPSDYTAECQAVKISEAVTAPASDYVGGSIVNLQMIMNIADDVDNTLKFETINLMPNSTIYFLTQVLEQPRWLGWNYDDSDTSFQFLYPHPYSIYGTTLNIAKYKIAAKLNAYTEETIETDITITPKTVIQNYLEIRPYDPAKEVAENRPLSHIVQEVYP